MSVKVSFNNQNIENPLLKFFITVLSLVLLLLIFMLIFFLIFPFIWFLMISMMLGILVILAARPRLVSICRVIFVNKKSLNNKKLP
jgi:hypothetical protein